MKNKYYSNTQDYINRWVVSYADFITLLLALFMVLFALSQLDNKNIKDFHQSVSKSFKAEYKKEINISKEELLERKHKLLKIFSTTETELTSSNINVKNAKQHTINLKNKLNSIEKDLNKELVEFENIKNQIIKSFNVVQGGDIIGLTFKQETRGLIIRLNDAVFFDPGSAIIKNKARLTLDKLAPTLKGIPNSIKIEGHTDNTPIKTSQYPSNWELSTARAINIINYLVKEHNYNPKKLSAVGYGEYMPIKPNTNRINKATNRRVDIVVLSKSSKIFDPTNN